jgi:hypothetical protein
MTVEESIELCLRTLGAASVLGYRVVVVEQFTEKPECYGLHRLHERTIYLSASANKTDEDWRETIAHEVAHSISPGDQEHGLPFQVALEYVRGLDVAGFDGPYRRWVDEEED